MALCTCGDDNTVTRQSGPHVGEYCASCDKWLRWIPQGIENFVWPIGAKHKGKLLLTIAKIDRPYLVWAAENLSSLPLKAKAQEALRHPSVSQGNPPQRTPQHPTKPQVPPHPLKLPNLQVSSPRQDTLEEDDSPPWYI